MRVVFLSNYINHHQIPFSDALYQRLGKDFCFIQTEPMEQERIKMGWALDASRIPYVVLAYEEEARCRRLLEEAELVLAGWTQRLDLILPRLSSGKLTFRISERIYREGQFKALSPRGLVAKYREHIRFRRQPVYLLCAGAYVASDFSLIHAYPGKKLKFGYFPQTRRYERDSLFEKKKDPADCMHLVWAGRMIALKHPEYAVRLIRELQAQGRRFHLHFVGGGPMEASLRQEVEQSCLADYVTFYGFLPADSVREVMECCHVHLFTSNYLEGWGAVINEAMNSGCCVVANAQVGAAPYLIEDGVNGLTYENGQYASFAEKVKALFEKPDTALSMGRAACRTITEEWNAERAAEAVLHFYETWKTGKPEIPAQGPLSLAPVLPARWKYHEGKLE